MSAGAANGQHDRLRRIEQRIYDDGTVRIPELARDLQVSEMTIRRDLDELETLGIARRIRGGAVAVGPEPFDSRHRHHAKAKAVIADKLLALVPDHGTVAFDASTTVYRLASSMEVARDLVVVTNGMDTFEVLSATPGVTATLTGGSREPRTGSLVGPVANRCAEQFIFDVFVCSAAALDPVVGSTEASLAEAETKRVLARTSSRVVLAADRSKLDGRAQARLFRPQEVDVLVTDLPPEDPRLDPYRDVIPELR